MRYKTYQADQNKKKNFLTKKQLKTASRKNMITVM